MFLFTSPAPAAVILTDDNRYVVTSSHHLLAILFILALVFLVMAGTWSIHACWSHKRAPRSSETATAVSPEPKATPYRQPTYENHSKADP
jgi:hypothetical protein